jgi:peptidoglycan hydrolase-like protein with peptidoglycan-binding domain
MRRPTTTPDERLTMEIRDLQATLHRAGFDAGPVSFDWSEKASEALKEYQKAKGLKPTGERDAETVAVLNSEFEQFMAPKAPEFAPLPKP